MEYASLIVSVLGIVLALVLYFADLRKMIASLLAREAGVLTAPQAKALVELYLESVRKELIIALLTFFKKEYIGCVDSRNLGAIDHFVTGTANVAINTARHKIGQFRIVGGLGFRGFVERVSPLDTDVIADAREKCRQHIRRAAEAGNRDVDRLAVESFRIVDEASHAAGRNMTREIERLYASE